MAGWDGGGSRGWCMVVWLSNRCATGRCTVEFWFAALALDRRVRQPLVALNAALTQFGWVCWEW